MLIGQAGSCGVEGQFYLNFLVWEWACECFLLEEVEMTTTKDLI